MIVLLLAACTFGSGGGDDVHTWQDPFRENAGQAPDGPDTEPVVEDTSFLYEGIQEITLDLSDMALAGLATVPNTNARPVHATFGWEGESYDVGLKLRGGENSFRTIDGKASFKIDFNVFHKDQRFHGLKALTLVNMVQDPSMIAEHVAYKLYADVGLVSPRHGYAKVTVNGTYYGLYGIVETIDEPFIDSRWTGRDGPMFEAENADLVVGDLPRFSTDLDERQPLDALVATLDATAPEDYLATLDDRFGADMALKHIAVDLVTGNADAYTTRANNWFVYYEEDADRWWTLPWGLDRAMRTDLDVTSLYRGRLYMDCWSAPDCDDRYLQVVQDVLTTWESDDLATFAQDTAAMIHDDCVADPRGPGGCDLDQQTVLAWIAARPDAVQAQLDAVH